MLKLITCILFVVENALICIAALHEWYDDQENKNSIQNVFLGIFFEFLALIGIVAIFA